MFVMSNKIKYGILIIHFRYSFIACTSKSHQVFNGDVPA